MNTLIPEQNTCLCGSDLCYVECCGPYHSGEKFPTTAEALMRSRFTAYARRDAEYLLTTWDASKRPKAIDFSKETAVWEKLSIVKTKKGGKLDSKGIVEFKAYYTQDNQPCFLHEISNFVKSGQHWLYLDGVIKAAGKVPAETGSGRNALCACGSGKKFKHCCGR